MTVLITNHMTNSPKNISRLQLDCIVFPHVQGEFYNIGQHKEPPFSPAPFSLPSQNTNMLYIGVSAFTINSAGFVYHSAGALSLNITDDMVSLIPVLMVFNTMFKHFYNSR